MATLSLGSHALFHYYQYRPDEDVGSPGPIGRGRAVDNDPVLSVLLEPRSLVITTGSLYTSHLHGIDDLTEDLVPSAGHKIANADLLGGSEAKEALRSGGILKRKIRYSLTCRDVERVATRVPFRGR